MSEASSVSESLSQQIVARMGQAGGWLPFDEFMQQALYAPGLGYYSGGLQKFGQLPSSGSDFVTAPELSPLFGRCVEVQVKQILQATQTECIYEFGAGSGALALQILEQTSQGNRRLEHYFIIEISAELRQRQRQTLGQLAQRVTWLNELPERLEGVVLGNEVLDAMPIKLLQRTRGVWHERGVAWDGYAFHWQDRPTTLRPPCDIAGEHDYLTEIHPQPQAFIRTVAERLTRGAALFIDYGFPEREYYHPQRSTGTLMTHQLHQSGTDPLTELGLKDITAHVDFTNIAVAAQADFSHGGLDVLGYTSQARFLLNCGLLSFLEQSSEQIRRQALFLVQEQEMGELFKVLCMGRGVDEPLLGFAQGDRSHTL
jgi:SAM-dependent MidA family methyltransferase